MPNIIKNNLTIKGTKKDIQYVLDNIKGQVDGEDSLIDFEQIAPIPEEEFNKDWHSARLKYWGEKWNAVDASKVAYNQLSFFTAWSCPFELFEALGRKFPTISFKVEYADEDLGYNCGSFTMKGEKYRKAYVINESDKAFEIVNRVWGDILEKRKDGTWARKEFTSAN